MTTPTIPTIETFERIVAADARERLLGLKKFRVPYWFGSGHIEINAADAAEALRKAHQFTDQDLVLAITGTLEMGDPQEVAP